MNVARDCFAKGEYHRQCHGPGECAWCGQKRARLYSYQWDSDGSCHRPDHSRAEHFCNLECFRSYHS